MRYIQKDTEPQLFSDWKALANEDWQPTYGNLKGSEKRDVYQSLLTEQGHICCYCERELIADDYHIEHLNPQYLRAGDDLDYANFICSCLNQTAKGVPLHCGKLKDDKIIPVHPLQEDCQSKFTYTAMGVIDGVDQVTKDTIRILGLDIDKLTDMRNDAVSPFLSDEIDLDQFQSFIAGYITPDEDGKRNAFCSMIEFLFKDFVEVR
jgi:uncharacterized protein (TIGR02646 family)